MAHGAAPIVIFLSSQSEKKLRTTPSKQVLTATCSESIKRNPLMYNELSFQFNHVRREAPFIYSLKNVNTKCDKTRWGKQRNKTEHIDV